jgi:1-acyl-sn-glycerol-3-phosphate acyltransferase
LKGEYRRMQMGRRSAKAANPSALKSCQVHWKCYFSRGFEIDLTTVGIVNTAIKGIFRTVCLVDDAELARIPSNGPLILVGNHVNFLEAPILITHLQPRPVIALVKDTTWNNPLFGPLFNHWKAIPIRRGEVDWTAFREALRILKEGKILAVAPEGTRSGNGVLQKGQSGIVPLAIKSGAPIMPVVYYGGERFWKNMRGFSRTPFTIRVGRPFNLKSTSTLPSRVEREQMTAEIMYQMALLLPPAYRGYYADVENATHKYLEFN